MSILFCFNGDWVKPIIRETNWCYENGTGFCMRVPKDIAFEQFKSMLYETLEMRDNEYKLTVKALYTGEGRIGMPPVEIRNDVSLEVYIDAVLNRSPVMMGVNVEPFIVNNQQPGFFDNHQTDMRFDNVDVNETDGNNMYLNVEDVESEHNSSEEYNSSGGHLSDYESWSDSDHSDYVPRNDDYPTGCGQASVGLVGEQRTVDFSGPSVACMSQTPEQHFDHIVSTSNTETHVGHTSEPFYNINAPTSRGTYYPTTPLMQPYATTEFGDSLPHFDIPPCLTTGTLDEPDDEDIFVGKEFDSKEDMYAKMDLHALKNDYQWRVSRTDKANLYLVCATSKDCDWRVRGILDGYTGKYRISVYAQNHTCGNSNILPGSRQAKPRTISRLIKQNVINLGKKFSAKNVQVKVNDIFGVRLNYQKAYRCKQRAALELGKTTEESYDVLPKYFHMLEKENPNTRTDVTPDAVGRFKYAFMALGASLVGWKYCRPILCIDGTHLNTTYGGKLLVAIGVDANDQLFPVAVAAVDGENILAWTYFLDQLKTAIGGERRDLVFISDRDKALIHSVKTVFPSAHHGYCYHHIKMNINAKFEEEEWNPATFKDAAYAYSRTVFDRKFREIQLQSSKVSKYLEKITFPKWARTHFPGTRYAIMTSNYAESFNNKIKEGRGRNITNMFEYIRQILQEWHCRRQNTAMTCTTELAKKVQELVSKNAAERRKYEVNGISENVYEVKSGEVQGRVNLVEMKCFCGKFQALGLPCVHAAAALGSVGGSLAELCSAYYRARCYKRIYEIPVNPVPGELDWVIPVEVQAKSVLPPPPKALGEDVVQGRRHGRTSTRRIPSLGEEPSSQRLSNRRGPVHCSRCKQPGHTKRKCRGPIPGIAQ